MDSNISDPACTCANDPNGANCTQLGNDLTTAWGDPDYQDPDTLAFYFGMIQTLPQYYGSGFISVDFVKLKPERTGALFFPGNPTNYQTYFQQLLAIFKTKNRTATIWTAEDSTPPFNLGLTANGTTQFKLTNLYVLNTNAVYDQNGNLQPDSDGDGLPDALELNTERIHQFAQ